MKVLYAMIYPPDEGGSGAPVYTDHLLRGMAERGEKPGMLFSTASNRRAPSEQAYYQAFPVKLARAPIFDSQPKIPSSIPFRSMSRQQVREYISRLYPSFRRAVVQWDYELAHVQHGMYIGYVASMIRQELGTPYVITLHIMELNFLPEFPDPVLAMAAMARADSIIALTQSQRRRLLNTYTRENILELQAARSVRPRSPVEEYDRHVGKSKIREDNIVVVPLGIDTEVFDIRPSPALPEDLRQLRIGEDEKVVLFAGRLIEMKGIRHLLASEPLYNRHNDVHTIILGGGVLEGTVAQACRDRAMVHYLGFKEYASMPCYYNFAAEHNGVFSVPSASEGMSLAYLEAMACGLPVVACCQDDMGELDFMQEPYASFAEFGDAPDLAEKIVTYLERGRPQRTTIRARAARYNVGVMVDGVFEVYKSVLHD
jgi:glycosyltransferase involved in cell wall biosynthesis